MEGICSESTKKEEDRDGRLNPLKSIKCQKKEKKYSYFAFLPQNQGFYNATVPCLFNEVSFLN